MPWAVAAAAVVVGGSMVAANQKKQAAKGAANAQRDAEDKAISEQQREFDIAQQIQAPQRNLGYGADAILAQLYGIPNPGSASIKMDANGNPIASGDGTNADGSPNLVGNTNPKIGAGNYSSFFTSPGYKFALDQGTQAINRNASARGDLYTTNNMAQLNDYAQGRASQQYNNYVDQVMQMAGLGAAASKSTADQAIATGNNISNAQLGKGNATASENLAVGGANASAVTTSANAIGGLFSGFSKSTDGG